MLSSSGGWLAQTLGWVPFFGFTVLAAIPGLLLLVWLSRHVKSPVPAAETARA
jgi:PAT family beta-lactamase induction signal transducer AmpG